MEQQTSPQSQQQEAQIKAYKTSKESFRAKIKELADEQPGLKKQRKTVYFTGERVVDASTAKRTHELNRYELRHLQAAYAATRTAFGGYTKKASFGTLDNSLVTKFMEEYGPKTVHINS